MVKNPPANAAHVGAAGLHPWVRGIPLEQEMATCSSILARKVLWTEEPGQLSTVKMRSLASPSSVHGRGHSKPVYRDIPERWDGGGGRGLRDGGTHVHPWLIHVNVWQKPPQYCKVIGLQLK